MKIIKLMCLCLSFILGITVLSGCGTGNNNSTSDSTKTPSSEKDDQNKPLPSDKIYSVLFIGNSYTKRYNMATEIFLPMAQATGYILNVKAIVNSGYTLESYADPNDACGALVAKELSEENYGKYDFVVLQEQSLRPITETAKFYDGVRALSQKIKAIGATPLLFSTWGRKTGSADLVNLKMTNESMTWHLAAIYNAIAEELDIPIAFVGLAFYDIYTNYPSIDIYDDDLYHPVYKGSFLAAATILAEMFNVDPSEIDFDGTLSYETAKTLRQAAYRAVFNTPEIPAEYITSSEDITG